LNVEPGCHDLFESRQDGAEYSVTGLAFDQLQILGDPVFVCDFVVIDEQDPLARRFRKRPIASEGNILTRLDEVVNRLG
jgi:hypothetical protein